MTVILLISIGLFTIVGLPKPQEGFDAIPMWIADMNFATAPTIMSALQERVQHPCFGYFLPTSEYFGGIINWHTKRHGVAGLSPECIGYENGVLGGVLAAFVVDKKRNLTFAHYGTAAGDVPTPNQLARILSSPSI